MNELYFQKEYNIVNEALQIKKQNGVMLMESEKLCINAVELSEMTGLSLSMVRKLTRCGEIPHIRIGRRILYPLTGIEGWISKTTITEGKERDKNV